MASLKAILAIGIDYYYYYC